MSSKKWQLTEEIDKEFEWGKWTDLIPYIQWPSDWLVKAIPPFTGAIIRYRITKVGLKDFVSVYLDCYDMLGCFDAPYWEVYRVDDDIIRCRMEDTEELLEYISKGLEQLGENNQKDKR